MSKITPYTSVDYSTPIQNGRHYKLDENLCQLVESMILDSDRTHVLHTNYNSPFGKITIYAITEKSGTLIVPLGDSIKSFHHQGAGTTIIAWNEEYPWNRYECYYQMKDISSEFSSKLVFLTRKDADGEVTCENPIVRI